MSDPGCPDPLLQGGALFGALRVALDLLRRALDARDLSDELFERAEYILLTLFEDNNFKTLSSGPPGPELLAPPEARRLKLNRNPDGVFFPGGINNIQVAVTAPGVTVNITVAGPIATVLGVHHAEKK